MSYATSGVGSQQHMAAQWFAQIAGIKLEHVPYRGGGQAINDLIAGHIKIASLGSTPLIPHYKAGTLRLLAQSDAGSARRACRTCRPIRRRASRGWCSTSGSACSCRPARRRPSSRGSMPRSTRRSPSRRSARASCNPAQEPVGGTAEQFAPLVHEDFEKYGRLVKELNIKAN